MMGASAVRLQEQSAQPSLLEQASVLLLEDNEFQRVALVQALRSLGVGTVVEAASIDEAIGRVAERAGGFDVCLCDLHLGEEEGVTFLRHAGMNAARSFVFISALDMTNLLVARRRALEHGSRVAGVLAKPVRRPDLLAMLEKAVREAERLR